jgi:hypothetical protein
MFNYGSADYTGRGGVVTTNLSSKRKLDLLTSLHALMLRPLL